MLEISNLSKRYANGYLALDRISLAVEPGEIVGIVGGSGCGKSTLLRMIAGLDRPSTGSVRLSGHEVTGPRPEIGMVFQEPRLMPWLSIADNVGFGLNHVPSAERKALVYEVLERVGLSAVAGAWPKELSGGMAQRAALARGLVGSPSILLLDEPFSALDALKRYDLQEHLLDLWRYDRPTLILVTHDIEEALFLCDRVVVMKPNPGRLHSAVRPGMPHPRGRTDGTLEALKQKLLSELRQAGPAAVRGEDLEPAAAI